MPTHEPTPALNTEPISARLFRTLTDRRPEGVLLLDAGGRILEANTAAMRRLGRSRDDLSGFPFRELVSGPEASIQVLEDSLARGHPHAGLAAEIGKGTDAAAVILAIEPLCDGGRTTGVVVTVRSSGPPDFREHSRFRSLFEHSHDAVILTDAVGIIRFASPSVTRLLGWDPEELLGRPGMDLTHPEDRDATVREFQRLLKSPGATLTFENRTRHKDGTYRILEGNGTNLLHDAELGAIVVNFRDMTEQRRQERSLRDERERFRTLADAVPQIVWIARPDGRHEFFNRRWFDYTGMTTDESLGDGWRIPLHPDDRERAEERWRRATEAGEPFEIEYRFRDRTRAYRWFLGRALPVRDAEGRVVRWFGTCTDIDDIKRAERVIARLNRDLDRRVDELQAIMDAFPLGLAIAGDAECSMITANEAFAELLSTDTSANVSVSGPESDRLPFRPYRNSVELAPDHLPMQRAARTGQIVHGEELEIRRDDGTTVDLLCNAVPLFDEQGRVRGALGVFLDITERNRAEAARRRIAERLALALSASGMADWTWDVSTDVIDLSPRAAEIFGLAEHRTRTRSELLDMIHPADREAVQRAFDRAIDEGVDYEVEYRVVRPIDGRGVWLAVRGRLVRDGEGRLEGMIGVLGDVTARRRDQATLQAAKESAERANKAKDHFLAALSHELRTPLTPVLMSVSELEHDDRLPVDAREDLAVIHRNVELEARLIDDLLDLTRITQGKLRLEHVPLDAHGLIRHAVDVCAIDLSAKRQTIRLQLDADRTWLRGDEARLHQVVWNLVKNASKFTPPEGSILVATENVGTDSLRIRVADTGIGIRPERLPNIFDAFEQESGEITRLFGGLGLGLAISKAVVDAHGGSIHAESPGRNHGSTFTIDLPLAPAPEQGGERGPWRPTARSGEPGLSILLVEDHRDTARILKRLLERAGHAVTTAASVAEGISAGRDGRFDILVSDLGLPDGSGLELARALSPLPAIALTGFGMEADIARCREAGFMAHLTKPVDFHQLEERIGQITGSRNR